MLTLNTHTVFHRRQIWKMRRLKLMLEPKPTEEAEAGAGTATSTTIGAGEADTLRRRQLRPRQSTGLNMLASRSLGGKPTE